MIAATNPRNSNEMLIMAIIVLAIIALFLSSCNCQKKLTRLQGQCPNLFVTDTIRITKNVITESIITDTVFTSEADTVEIIKEKLRIKYIRIPGPRGLPDTVKIEGQCQADTIPVYVEIPVEKAIFHERTWYDRHSPLFILLALISGFLLAFFGLSKRTKR